jgi:MFS superfamily sulfate permease-like transporter
VKLLEEHLQHPRQAKRADTCFLCGLFFAVVVLPMMLVVGVIVGIIMVILAVLGKL